MAYLSRDWLFLVKGRPLNKLNFWLIGNNFYKNQDIALKFSAYVHHMSALNWQKNLWHYSISVSAAPPRVPKLPTPLATIFVEILKKKIFGEVLDLYQLPHGRNFEYLEKMAFWNFWNESSVQVTSVVHDWGLKQHIFCWLFNHHHLVMQFWTKSLSYL